MQLLIYGEKGLIPDKVNRNILELILRVIRGAGRFFDFIHSNFCHPSLCKKLMDVDRRLMNQMQNFYQNFPYF